MEATKSDETDSFKNTKKLRWRKKRFMYIVGVVGKWLNQGDDKKKCRSAFFVAGYENDDYKRALAAS